MLSLKTSSALVGLALALSAGTASAQGLGYGYDAYDHYGYGFAEPAIRGEYIGAPLTRTPRPSDLVPTVWGYGTYGIPTMTGIRSAPTGIPTVYVIEGQSSDSRRRGDRRFGRDDMADMRGAPVRGTGGGARVIQVTVPRR